MPRVHRSNNNPSTNTVRKKNAPARRVENVHIIQKTIDHHWTQLPVQAKNFLLEAPYRLTLHKLANFWSSSPLVVQYTRGIIAGSACGTSWFIALNYLKLGKLPEARALTLNGAFLDQCFKTPIETIVQLCRSDVQDSDVPLFSEGLFSLRTPETMERYLHKGLPPEQQHQIASFAGLSDPRNIMNYVGQIGDDWGSSCQRSRYNPSSQTPGGTRIQLILVDNTDKGVHSFDIVSSAALKTLLNAYAEKRGVCLRSLRFSCGGKTLFLSSVGNKTPDELNLRDQDVITVHDTSSSEEVATSSNRKPKPAPKKTKKSKNRPKKTKRDGENKQREHEELMNLEECKVRHSKMLSKLHEEVQPKLKKIRTRLNALDLERQPPKRRRAGEAVKKKVRVSPDLSTLPNPGVGGKAGKSYFPVQVGEVQNLYKTNKRATSSSQNNPHGASTLDLHGCTRQEALRKLDESLEIWVDTAMRGGYPFIIRASIICGCGSQVLSETVQEWIKTTRQVCNAPKNSLSRA